MIPAKDDIINVIHERETKFEEFLDNDPLNLSVSKLKKSFNDWYKEVRDARKFTKEYDTQLSKEDLGFVYTLMNEYSAFRVHSIVASLYIKKLEMTLFTNRGKK